MKAKQFILINDQVKNYLISQINEIKLDGKTQVKIMNTGTKTQRQQGLDWQHNKDIMDSGVGYGDADLETVHARNKWLFARPILIRDDEVFRNIYNYFMAAYGHDQEKCLDFAKNFIRTQNMSIDQVSEYMKDKQRYWVGKGVNLTDPEQFKLKRF